jgi:hypothetical protein
MGHAFDLDSFRDLVSADLRSAMKRRETNTVAALRNVLHIVDNTGAIPLSESLTTVEVARRIPDVQEVEALLRSEVDELQQAAEEYRRHGVMDRAEALAEKAEVVSGCISYLAVGE